MRKVLFRGKRLDNGKWIYGGIICKSYKYFIVTESGYRPDTRDWDTLEYFENHPQLKFEQVEVDPDTVGQYIGLTSINNSKIYEDDIVKNQDCLFVVKFGNCGGVQCKGAYGYIGFYLDGYDDKTRQNIKKGLRKDICYYLDDGGLEVVGNIHDNQNLWR